MLATYLRLAAVESGLEYVGSTAVTQTATTYSITGLTGGADSAPRAGDTVVACVGVATVNTSTLTNSQGYTKAAQVRDTGVSNGIVMGVFYKTLAAEETSITINDEQGGTASRVFVAHVWRNVSPSIALAGTTTTAVGTSGRPNAPAITTTAPNAVVIAVGAASYATGVTPQALTAPDGMENFRTISSSGASRPRIGVASLMLAQSQAYDPPTFGGGSPNTDSASAAITLALRPA